MFFKTLKINNFKNLYFNLLKFHNTLFKNSNFSKVINFFFKKKFFLKSVGNFLKNKKPWYTLLIKKFNFLKKILLKNFKQIFFFQISNNKVINFFKILKKTVNLNFFYLYYFRLINLPKISFFFISLHYFLKIFYDKGFFLNGQICQNYLYFFSFASLLVFQIVWSKYFLFMYISQYNIWKRVFKKKKFFKWLYFFRKKVQQKTPKKKFPKFLQKLEVNSFFNTLNLETSFWLSIFYWLPYINLLTHFIIFKYINIYNHRLYLWKHVI